MLHRRQLIVAAGASMAFAGSSQAQVAAPVGLATAVKRGVSQAGGASTPYRVETGEMVMPAADGSPGATIFSVSYIAESGPKAGRPVTFVFNGGPGGATWPLREAVSPKMIVRAGAPKGYGFADNPDSLIDVTDLVFIDAPGTGYSRMLSEPAKGEFWGVEQDGRAFADFIQRWLAAHGRRGSPKFILGESYGGARTAQLVRLLASRSGGADRMHGAILISPVLSTKEDVPEHHLDATVAALPTQACVARYHGRGAFTAQPVETVAASARAFANGPYRDALQPGARLDADHRRRIAGQVAGFIGLPQEVVLREGLAVSNQTFRNLLLADRGERVGEDGRRHRPPLKPGESDMLDVADGYDLQAAIEGLLRDELGYRPIGGYRRDPTEINRRWDYKITAQPYELQDVLKAEMAANTGFRAFLAGGYFDLIVPWSLPLTGLERAGLPTDRFVHRAYRTGHEVLRDSGDHARATDDMRAFYRETLV